MYKTFHGFLARRVLLEFVWKLGTHRVVLIRRFPYPFPFGSRWYFRRPQYTAIVGGGAAANVDKVQGCLPLPGRETATQLKLVVVALPVLAGLQALKAGL